MDNSDVSATTDVFATQEDISDLTAQLYLDANDILSKAHVGEGTISYDAKEPISKDRLLQVVLYALRDLRRVEIDQKYEISIVKYAAYIAFWFAKLKPIIRVVLLVDGDAKRVDEVLDVNEKAAVLLMQRVLMRIALKPDLAPAVWRQCNNGRCFLKGEQVHGQCFFDKFAAFRHAQDGKHFDYLVYSLRYRPASPYMLVAILDQGIFLSCSRAVDGALENIT